MKLFLRSAAVVLACVSFIGTASAVDMSLGLKGGLNLATTVGGEDLEEGVDKVMKPGLNIGAALELKLMDNFSIQPEVLFTSKGMKMKADYMGEEMIQVINMNYLEIPVLFKLNIPAGVAVPNLYVGPAMGFRVGVGGYAKMGDEKEDMTDEGIDALKDETNGFDFGLAMGGGCNFVVGPGAIILDVRYSLGLMKIAKLTDEMKEVGMSESDLDKDKNGVLGIGIGYAFNIGG